MSLQALLTQLKIVGCVPQHGRLAIGQGDTLVVESEIPYITPLRRWMRGDGRGRVLRALSTLTEAAAEKVADLAENRWLREDRHGMQQGERADRRAQVRHDLGRIADDIAAAVEGMRLMRESTYARDPVATSELEVLADRLGTVARLACEALSGEG